jgi:hypothetical protein
MRRLGFAFRFVVDDLTQKTDTLAMYMRSEAAHYRTVRSMVDYERAMGTVANERPPMSGAVSLIILNRTLLFVVRLIEHLHSAPPHVKISKIAKKDYVDTLAEFHPRYIRAAVRMALHKLPTRQEVGESSLQVLSMYYSFRWSPLYVVSCLMPSSSGP